MIKIEMEFQDLKDALDSLNKDNNLFYELRGENSVLRSQIENMKVEMETLRRNSPHTALESDVTNLIIACFKQDKIAGIKFVRESTGLGLVAAKELYEESRAEGLRQLSSQLVAPVLGKQNVKGKSPPYEQTR